jgi:hypothetical protein
MSAMELTTAQQFEKQRLKNAIRDTSSVEELRAIATLLTDAFFTQKAASAWIMATKFQDTGYISQYAEKLNARYGEEEAA